MLKNNYLYLVINLIAFTLCVGAFTLTGDVFQYLLAVFNLGLLFNTVRISIELGL